MAPLCADGESNSNLPSPLIDYPGENTVNPDQSQYQRQAGEQSHQQQGKSPGRHRFGNQMMQRPRVVSRPSLVTAGYSRPHGREGFGWRKAAAGDDCQRGETSLKQRTKDFRFRSRIQRGVLDVFDHADNFARLRSKIGAANPFANGIPPWKVLSSEGFVDDDNRRS